MTEQPREPRGTTSRRSRAGTTSRRGSGSCGARSAAASGELGARGPHAPGARPPDIATWSPPPADGTADGDGGRPERRPVGRRPDRVRRFGRSRSGDTQACGGTPVTRWCG